jgi:cyclophilin family peptidyl-prolyl cis-trans isomerase/HEAT repeat protein
VVTGPADQASTGRGRAPIRFTRVAGVARRWMLTAAAAFAMASLAAAENPPEALAAGGGGRPSAGTKGGSPPDLPAMQGPGLDLRAMLLLLEERRSYEPVTVLEALKGGPELRADLAAALGRAQDREGRPVLEGLLIDEQPEVRRAAAFGLGLVGDPAARPALLKAVHDPDRDTGALAVEALGRLATPVLEVAEQLLALPDGERWARLLPNLFRFKEEALLPLAEHGLGLGDPQLHRQAAYALARDPLPAAAPLLRRLAGDPDPLVRAWAARGLGRVGGAADLPALLPLLGDAAPGPVVEALRAAAALIGAAKPAAAAAAGAWRARVLALLADPRAGVRVTAIEAAEAWLPDPDLGAALAARAASSPAPNQTSAPPGAQPSASAPGAQLSVAVERGLALVALARGKDPRAAALAAAAAGAAEPRLRARAAEAAGLLGDAALLARLAADPSALVREAALTARLPAAPRPPAAGMAAAGASRGAAGRAGGAAAAARAGAGSPGFSESAEKAGGTVAAAALGDPDEGVRATACDWLADHPVVTAAQLAGALVAALRDESIESPLGAIKALAARAEAEPRERGTVVELLERTGGQPSYPLRREAAAALARLGRPAPPLAPAGGGKAGTLADDLDTYREIVERTRRPRTVEVRTNRGSFRLRLDCPRAPRTCLNFLQLAAQHFYDGLLFHRVVPDFVIQAGDPRGDGFGGPGYTIRDEINRLRYGRGVAGMALAGPDTGGSQFFVTLSPQPHLDGGYTAFGEVAAGAEVLDAIQAGDRIETIVEVR